MRNRLDDNLLQSINAGSGIVIDKESNSIYKKIRSEHVGTEANKYHVIPGQRYVIKDGSNFQMHIVVAVSNSYEKPGNDYGTRTHAKFEILESSDRSMIGRTEEFDISGLGFLTLYEYI